MLDWTRRWIEAATGLEPALDRSRYLNGAAASVKTLARRLGPANFGLEK